MKYRVIYLIDSDLEILDVIDLAGATDLLELFRKSSTPITHCEVLHYFDDASDEEALRKRFPNHGMLPDGKEAEELRQAITKFCEELEEANSEGRYSSTEIEDLLRSFRKQVEEEIDARDSLVYVEANR